MDVQPAAGHDILDREQVIADPERQQAEEEEGGDEGHPHPERGLTPVVDVLLVGGDDLPAKVEAPENVQVFDIHISPTERRAV
jgi:hypothetical protein